MLDRLVQYSRIKRGREFSPVFMVLFVVFVSVIAACAGGKAKPKPKDPLAKAKIIKSSQRSKQAVDAEDQALDFIRRNLNDSYQFSASDEESMRVFAGSTPQGSAREAAVALGTVKIVLRSKEQNSNVKESELLNAEEFEGRDKNISLEALFLEKGINLAEVIEKNPNLQSLVFYKLCLRALKASANSQTFIAATNQAIAQKVQVSSNATSEADSSAKENISTPTAMNWEKLDSYTANLRLADQTLSEAQMLADSRKYREAITKAEGIGEENPLREAATTSIREFSDRAVADLRQKAAQAFQSSSQVNDPRSKVSYLSSAKIHLEQALQEYPLANADQLNTVKENLAVISNDIDRYSIK